MMPPIEIHWRVVCQSLMRNFASLVQVVIEELFSKSSF